MRKQLGWFAVALLAVAGCSNGAKGGDILASIRDKRELTAENEEKLKTFVENFAKTFV